MGKPRNIAVKILELRKLGYSYNQIQEELNCSKSTITYHCGENQKVKNKQRTNKFRQTNPLSIKLYQFTFAKSNQNKKNFQDNRKAITNKLLVFNKRNNMSSNNITLEQVVEKIGENPKCYLTGELIDISKPSTYAFDHMIPSSRGGQNTIDNLGLCTQQANIMKNNLTPDEFISYCQKILINAGYQVINPSTNN